MNFSPRLAQMLFLLLKSETAIKSDALAQQLNISKRSVFRELENVNRELEKYHIHLENKKRQGFILVGSQDDKLHLLQQIERMDAFDPYNREERQKQLIYLLLREDEPRKLFYFADALQVSEATISNDLEAVQAWFANYHICIDKKGGCMLRGSEYDYRQALQSYAERYADKKEEIVPSAIFEDVEHMLRGMEKDVTEILTKSAYESFAMYLVITLIRIAGEHPLTEMPHGLLHGQTYSELLFTENLAKLLHDEFSAEFGNDEQLAVCLFLRSCKRRNIQQGVEILEINDKQIDLRDMVYAMANLYDPAIAHELKQDELLVQGLITHLRTAVTRMAYGLSVKNSLAAEIKEKYRDIYEKACCAVTVMAQELQMQIPEEEIAYIALHFGGAQTRLKHDRRRLRTVDVGVVCAGGIGISNLLSSRIMNYFGEKVNIQIFSKAQLERGVRHSVDFIVAAMDVSQTDVPCLKVSPMIRNGEMEAIAELVERYARTEKKTADASARPSEMHEVMQITEEIRSIVSGFHVYRMPDESSYEEVLRFGCSRLGGSRTDSQQIYDAINEREALSTQVIEAYDLVLFHAAVEVVDQSRFILILPNACFTDPYFCGVHLVLMMVISKNDARETQAISAVSRALFEDDDFLPLLKTGNEAAILCRIEKYLNRYLEDRVKKIYH